MRPKECQSSRVITSLLTTPSHTGKGSYQKKIPIKASFVSFELGSERKNVTHRLETTTQPAVAKEKVDSQVSHLFKDLIWLHLMFKYVTVFVLAVNEQSFVDDHLEDLKTTTWKYMTE